MTHDLVAPTSPLSDSVDTRATTTNIDVHR